MHIQSTANRSHMHEYMKPKAKVTQHALLHTQSYTLTHSHTHTLTHLHTREKKNMEMVMAGSGTSSKEAWSPEMGKRCGGKWMYKKNGKIKKEKENS